MKLVLNNTETEFKETATLSEFLAEQKNIPDTGVAVAVNQVVIPKSGWASTYLNENDNILIIQATQGG